MFYYSVLFYRRYSFTPLRMLNIFHFCSIIPFLRSSSSTYTLNFSLQAHFLGCFLLLFFIVWSHPSTFGHFAVFSPQLTMIPCQQVASNPKFIPFLILPWKWQPIQTDPHFSFTILETLSRNYNLTKMLPSSLLLNGVSSSFGELPPPSALLQQSTM